MARKNVTKVKFEKFVRTAEKLGMTVKSNKGFTKVWPANGSIKQSLGIPNTKRVTRVELIGFESELAIAHPAPSAGTVTQMLDFGQDEALILRSFYKVSKALCEAATLAAIPVAEPVVEAPVAEVELETAVG
jgi:hypothetical protein